MSPGKKAAVIELSAQERETLESCVRNPSGEHRYVVRARIVVLATEGAASKDIAERLNTRGATASQPDSKADQKSQKG